MLGGQMGKYNFFAGFPAFFPELLGCQCKDLVLNTHADVVGSF